MLHLLPGPLRGLMALPIVVMSTVLCVLAIYAAAFLKYISPEERLRRLFSRTLAALPEWWISVNNGLMESLHRISWEITGLDGLRRDRWYLICCNHQSAVDIPVLQRVFRRHVPFMRFFIKQELLWVPLLGLAWRLLDYPFVKRHSKEYLAKHPEMRGKDLETTRRICMRFLDTPTSILNFVEGTRFTPSKHASQNSPYIHLLKPKAGGMALAIASMGEIFSSVLDVTIAYPEGVTGLWGLFAGRLSRVAVHVEQREIPGELLGGDYAGDPVYRERFQRWIQGIWREKDALLAAILEGAGR